MKDKKKIIARQKYTFEIRHFNDGTIRMYRNNKGFSAMDMIAIGTLIQQDNLQPIIKPKVENIVMKKAVNVPFIRKP